MSLRFVPKIVYGSGPTTLILTYPVKLWEPAVAQKGGKAVADSGVPEAYVIRRDQLVTLDLRFLENEWTAVDTWLEFAQTAQAFDFYFDKDQPDKYTVYLDKPEPGDGQVQPQRDSFTKAFALTITLRTVDKSRFNTLIFS